MGMVVKNILGMVKSEVSRMIDEVILKNFKVFEEETHFPLSRVTILYGKNGRGKSSLIQSLLLMSQTIRKRGEVNTLLLNDEFVYLGMIQDVKHSKCQSSSIEIGIHSSNSVRCYFDDYPEKPTWAKLENMEVKGKSIFSEKGNVDGSQSSDVSSSESQSSIEELQDLQHVYYLSAERMGPRNYADRVDVASSNRLGIRGEYLLNVLDSEKAETIQKVQEILSRILSGATIKVPDNDKSSIIELYLDSYDNGGSFRPSNVGFGYSFVLPVILQVMFAKEGDLIIIENPEAHLHPWAESELMKFIVAQAHERKFQVILESHSDHIVNGLRIAVKKGILSHDEANILHFGRIEDKEGRLNPMVRQISIDPYGNLSDYPEDFLDEWTKELLELV